VASCFGKDDFIVSDELNHASIIGRRAPEPRHHQGLPAPRRAGPRARSSGICPGDRRRLIITDGVFSMDGDLGALPELCDVADEFGCIMMVDDAHASGVFGSNGRGTVDHFRLHGRVDIQVGTLSKAIGVLGGYVAGSKAMIEFLYHRGAPFLFSTSHPPPVARRAWPRSTSRSEPQLIERLWEKHALLQEAASGARFQHRLSESPITPVIVGEARCAMKLSDALFRKASSRKASGFRPLPATRHACARS
jgi:glycine C-acetyltransferase